MIRDAMLKDMIESPTACIFVPGCGTIGGNAVAQVSGRTFYDAPNDN